VALLLACAAGCNRIETGTPSRTPPSSANLLLITIDTLRADHVGAYGASSARTPTLDALAREGVRFRTAIAPVPLTVPSHASLMTGLYPPRHGVRHNAMFPLADSAQTLAQRLRRAGYATAAVVGSVALARDVGLDRGFDHYDDEIGSRLSARAGYRERRAEQVSERAAEWLTRAQRPFFLWVHYFDPHADYAPPPPFSEAFADHPYDGEIAYVDASLGRLLIALEADARPGDTLVVVTSDHGESLGEHREGTHGYTLYDATQAVPLLFRGPRVPRGGVVDSVVSLVDVAPTILTLLGLEPATEVDGRSLAPLWDALPADRPAYTESLATQLDHGWSPLHALRSQRFLYVRAPRPELYEIASDPAQRENLLEKQPERAHREIARLGPLLDGLLAEARPLEPLPVSEATRERLRALGYALPDAPAVYNGMDPKDGLLWEAGFERAVEDYLAGELERPKRFLRAMIEAVPSSGLAHGLLAAVHLAAGEARLALPLAEKAHRLAARSTDHASLLGDVRRVLGDVDGALEAYRSASRLDPRRREPRLAILQLELSRGRLEAAEAAARECIALAPKDSEAWTDLGAAWNAAEQPGRALEAFREALRLDPSSERAHALSALVLLRLGKRRESEGHLKAAPNWSRTPSFRHRLAVAHADHGDAAVAEEIFRELIAMQPTHPGPRHRLATLLRRMGRTEEARALEPTP
jgi:arylsulfatase A-like enzyme/Flp pilus assembly protein TadD